MSKRVLGMMAVAVLAVVLSAAPAAATTLAWDPGNTGGAGGGSGTWDWSTVQWWDGTNDVAWPNSSSPRDDVLFAGTAGAVSLRPANGSVTLVGDMEFRTENYILGLDGGRYLSVDSFSGDGLASSIIRPWGTTSETAGIYVRDGQNAVYTGTLTDNGSAVLSLNKYDAGTLTLKSANTYSGQTTLTAGTICLGNDQALGTGPIKFYTNGAVLSSDSSATRTIANPWVNETGNPRNYEFGDGVNDGELIFTDPGPRSTSGAMTVNCTRVTVAASLTAGNFSKKGPGVLVLNGGISQANSPTIVEGGSLWLNGDSAFLGRGSSSNITAEVKGGATLGGSATIQVYDPVNSSYSHQVVIRDNGTLAPGPEGAIGTLTFDFSAPTGQVDGSLQMQNGAEFAYDLGAPGVGDLLRFYGFGSGMLVLNDNIINFTVPLDLPGGTHTYTLMEFYSDSGSTLTDTGKPTSGLVIGSGLDDPMFLSKELDYTETGKILLHLETQVSSVPEPAGLGLVGLALLGLRKRRS